jgi:hypothetical protein
MTQTSMVTTFGNCTDGIPASDEFLTLKFSPSSIPRKRRWNNYGLSADFLGDYFAAFFPGDSIPDSKINHRDTVKAAVSYIANELLENAVKYNDEMAQRPISISLYLYDRHITFHTVNYANQAATAQYQQFIQELLISDVDEMYTRQLEKTAIGAGSSNIGILTMMNDYAARFGWKFQPLELLPEMMEVNVFVDLDV